MTYNQILSRVRLQIAEDNESYFDDTDIQSYITSALQRFLSRTRAGVVRETIAHTTGTSTYNLSYRPNIMMGITLVPTSDAGDRELSLTQVSYEDWQRFSSDYREDTYVCYVNNSSNTISIPANISGGSLYLEYSIRATDATTSTIIDTGILPEEYTEAIADYACFLAFRRDREFNMANSYFQSYYAVEQEAIKEVAEREPHAIGTDWNTENTNPHRSSDTSIQDISEM